MVRRFFYFCFVVFVVCGCASEQPSPTVSVQDEPSSPPVVAQVVPQVEPSVDQGFHLSTATIADAEEKYGPAARLRLREWESFIRTDTSATDMEKLKKVNAFFNKLSFVEDDTNWGVDDYWATPIEFLSMNGGDCEDYSLAKYFTLIAMGVNKRRLSLTYAEKLDADEPHLILTYFEVPGEEPYILDNLSDDILLSSKRSDLLPVYSVNNSGLWVANTRSQRLLVGTDDSLTCWQQLLTRMPEEFVEMW